MKKARFWVGMLISVVALIFAFRQVDLRLVWTALAGINYWLVAASVLFLLLFLLFRAFRWRLLFFPQQGMHISNLLAVINIGYLVSNILPARLGDVARAYLIGDTEPVSRTAAFSTVVAERVLDALCAVIGFLVVLPFAPVPQWMIRGGLIVGGAAVVAVVLFVVLVRRREWTLRLLDRILVAIRWPDREAVARRWGQLAGRTHLRFLAHLPWADRPRLASMASSLIDGLGGITSVRLGPQLVFWSAVIWIDITLFYWLIMLAFDSSQPFVAGLAVNSVTALGMTVPSSPGSIGVFEFTASQTASLFGMTLESAMAYALVAHAIVYGVYTVLGLLSLAHQNLTYAEVQRRISAEVQETS